MSDNDMGKINPGIGVIVDSNDDNIYYATDNGRSIFRESSMEPQRPYTPQQRTSVLRDSSLNSQPYVSEEVKTSVLRDYNMRSPSSEYEEEATFGRRR